MRRIVVGRHRRMGRRGKVSARELVPPLQSHQVDERLPEPHSMKHYLYFATEEDADTALARLGSEGFHGHSGPWGGRWLALVSHAAQLSSESITAVCKRFGELASSLGGEYDGWEPAVRA